MCRAVLALCEAAGVTNLELSHLLGVAQGTTWKWISTREPRYNEVLRIEKVLDLPHGTLFAAAGYTPTQDAIHAVGLDQSLTAEQKERISAVIRRARKARTVEDHLRSEAFVLADQSIPLRDRVAISNLIVSAKYENQSRLKKPRKQA